MKRHKIDMEKRSTVLMIAIVTTGGRIAEVWKMTAKKLAVGFCLACGAALSADALHPDIGNGGDVAHCIGGMCESGGKGRSALMLAAGE